MSTPVIRVKVTPRTVIKGKMDVRFPASVSAESPILLTKAGGSYSFGFDMNVVLEAVNFGGFVLGPASAVDGHFPQYDGTTGKKLKDGKAAPAGEVVGTSDTQALTNKTLTAPVINSPTGLVKADVGLGNVDNTSDATKNSAAVTLTNKTINASNNSISNLTTAMFAANVVDNDGTLAANSSTRIPTQAAVKAYADQVVAATDAMVFKGVIDCSSNPNYPAADRGWTYKVSVAGKIGGASGVSVEVGDTAMCLTDGTASGNQATVGANWNIVQANLVGAVTGPASSTSGNVATFNGTGGTVIQDSGKALPAGSIVGTSDTQTLTGKTIDTASNTFKLNGVSFGTATQATAALNSMVGDSGSGGTKGLVPAPASGDAAGGKYLRADGNWAAPPGGGGGTATPVTPQGRLTLQTGVPVMTSTQSAKTTIYYTPYVGNIILIYDGLDMIPTEFNEISVATTDTTKNPAAIGASKVNDWFVWDDSGTLRLSHGPDWTNDTTRSAGTALTRVNGIWLNSTSITNGPAASRGTYVGTTRSNASSQLDWIIGGAASGGVAGFLGVWNAYNRVNVAASSIDNGTSYTYTTSSFRQARASSGNQVSFIIGLSEEAVDASYSPQFLTNTNNTASAGIGLNSTSTPTSPSVVAGASAGLIRIYSTVIYKFIPPVGFSYIAALELSDGGANTYNAASSSWLSCSLRM